VAVEKGAYSAAEQLLVAVTSELTGESACLVSKSKKCELNVVVLEGFKAKRPVVAGGAVDEDESKFVPTNRDAVSKSNRRSCNELQSNLIMINHYIAFYHKIPNKNFMSIVKMKSMYVYGSYPSPVLTLPSLHHSMTKILNILFSRILSLYGPISLSVNTHYSEKRHIENTTSFVYVNS
jgi:hypothetical protein